MKTEKFKVLAINPGSTSTKVAVFEDEAALFEETVRHHHEELDRNVPSQLGMRKQVVLDILNSHGVELRSLDAVVGRGGLIRPIESGTYVVGDNMLRDLNDTMMVAHASTLGALIAHDLVKDIGIPCYIVDPVVVDESESYAKLTGLPGLERQSIFHALNQKAVARRCAADMGLLYENCRFVVAHMGGGISVGAHRYGRVIDVNDALAGEGPFSPERTGGLPASGLIKLCFSGDYTEKELLEIVSGRGGMLAYLGINDLRQCDKMIMEGDEYAGLVLQSMAYQVSKEIGAMVAALEGRVDAIVLTGGLAWSNRFTGHIKQHVNLIAPVKTYPGEEEMRSMVEGVLRVLRGQERAKDYLA